MSNQPPKVQLNDMTEQAFEKWTVHLVEAYATDHVEAGNWSESEALEKARESVENLLPKGIHTEDHFLYTIVDKSTNLEVGVLWLGSNARIHGAGFIYDLEIGEQFRREGYATAAMRALETKAKTLGMEKLSLHVFASNERARSLYEKLGYEMTGITMAKKL